MSGVGFWELILVFLIGLIVLGPERLPRVAQQLGTWLGQARRMTRVMRRQLEDELNFENELSIRPRSRPLPPPTRPPRAADADDTYSPAHDKSDAGTGVEQATGDDAASAPDAGSKPERAADAGSEPERETEPGDKPANDPADPAGQVRNP